MMSIDPFLNLMSVEHKVLATLIARDLSPLDHPVHGDSCNLQHLGHLHGSQDLPRADITPAA